GSTIEKGIPCIAMMSRIHAKLSYSTRSHSICKLKSNLAISSPQRYLLGERAIDLKGIDRTEDTPIEPHTIAEIKVILCINNFRKKRIVHRIIVDGGSTILSEW